jgi:hypothetical protein
MQNHNQHVNYRTYCEPCQKWIHMGDLVTCGKGEECCLKQPHHIENLPDYYIRAEYQAMLDKANRDLEALLEEPDCIEHPYLDDPYETRCEECGKPLKDEVDETAYPDDNPKTAVGLTKPSFSAIPPVALIHLGRAMADGRKKYGLMNWREKTVTTSVYYDAALRHLMSFWDGEDLASDSLVEHLGHVMACCAIILDAASNGQLNDDRPVPGMFPETVAALTKVQG